MEIWKTAIYNGEIYGNYEVSNAKEPQIRNKKTGKIIKQRQLPTGYVEVIIYKNGKMKHCYVHRLVACTFIENDDVENKTEVNHINEDKTLNSVENLEWCTREYNQNYGTRIERGVKARSKKVIGKSLTENKVVVLQSAKQGEKFGFKQQSIWSCCNGKQNQYKGYVWSYIENESTDTVDSF